MTQEEAEIYIQKVATELGEHFDAVQILVSWNEESSTMMEASGAGNWYARQGMAREFLNKDQAQTIAHEAKLMRDGEDLTWPRMIFVL